MLLTAGMLLLVPGWVAYEFGVEPRTRLSSRSICDMIRRLSEMWISGFRRKRRLAPDSVLSLHCELGVALLPQTLTVCPLEFWPTPV